jgi:hypothetical protein
VNSEKIYVEVPGELGWRQYELHELVWLWRTAQLPHNAKYQDTTGQWLAIEKLVDPIIARENQTFDANPSKQAPRLRHAQRWFWSGLAVFILIGGICSWPVLRARYFERQAKQQAAQDDWEWERQTRIEDLIKSGQVVPGMTPEQVRRSWGEPRSRKATADGVHQQWIYRHGTVMFENGTVSRVGPKR